MMFHNRGRWTLLRSSFWLCAVVLACDSAHSATASARKQVRTGLEQHQAGDYAAAAESFAEAQKSLPEEPRVVYDRACALAAAGNREEATDLFQQAAIAREPGLVASSHYNLGCLVAEEARALFGDQPEEADVAAREQGVKLLHQAVMHYRDCLRVDSDHAAARKNLETIRLWIKHMEAVWAQRDREKRRDEMDLLQFLDWIDAEQRTLEAATKALGQIDGSPRQRQAVSRTEDAQRLLADEIDPLQQKLEAALTGDQPADATTAQAVQALNQIAQRAKSAMFRSADELVGRELPSALVAQDEAIDALDEVYRAVAPYEHLLQKATKVEQSLVETTVSIAEDDIDEALVDREAIARDQRYVAGWSESLPARAEQGLAQIEAGSGTHSEIGPPTDEQQKEQQQLQAALKESYEKAIELAPKVTELANGAASDIADEKWDVARPKQEEALKLLQEISPKTPPNENQQDQQGEQNEDKQDQQDNQPDEQQGDEGNQQQDQQRQEKSSEQKQQDLSRQQAEALLSKARQREREYRERQKAQIQAMQGTIQVDRDW
ncbi:MAG: hypothetical protein H6822_06355 [Planctomycetaceae bacterium]|nr:hypothetical protein [Planctomycetales bacterium]MCB9921783.1 hypothetical protein [Planctomycetaceae bacterium]